MQVKLCLLAKSAFTRIGEKTELGCHKVRITGALSDCVQEIINS
jgi:hypothetical protein